MKSLNASQQVIQDTLTAFLNTLMKKKLQSLEVNMRLGNNAHGYKTNQGYFTTFSRNKGFLGLGGRDLKGNAHILQDLLAG